MLYIKNFSVFHSFKAVYKTELETLKSKKK